ncbi:uncharacterized protein [Spinacia oleracea]|uniref:Signal peptidase complex catalytic subunit SEC11 n=1 Tax=Spinacia oleracea TaxID=3562 RepID=A0ABM3QS73_SPIOL|nr:uncharacterized protein LOC110788102 [Spinacia oleracea]
MFYKLMAWVRDQIDGVKSIKMRQLMIEVVGIAMVVMMLWKALIWYTDCEFPMNVVLSGSMEPGFKRGDILLSNNRKDNPIRVGEIVLYKIGNHKIPIVHRVIEVHNKRIEDTGGRGYEGVVKILTKGDNNQVDDRGLYGGQHWLQRHHIIGRVQLLVPYIGWFPIIFFEYPMMRCLFLVVFIVLYLKSFINENGKV